jgi:hypothetical protein
MGRRRVRLGDREGDPLSGLVNLWNVSLALTVGLVVATLAALGLTAIATGSDFATVVDPEGPATTAVSRTDGSLLGDALDDVADSDAMLLGELYRLPDGRLVYVPSVTTTPSAESTPSPYPGTTPYPGATPSSGVYPTPPPTVPPSPYATPTPTWYPTSTPTPTPSATDEGRGKGPG